MGRTARYPDLYEVLGAARGADPEELKAAYRARTRELQPDAAEDPVAEQRFRELTDAYAVLSKSPSRSLYDRLAHGAIVRPVDADVASPTLNEIPEPEPEPPAVVPEPIPRDERMVRLIAAAALVVSIVFLVAVLLA